MTDCNAAIRLDPHLAYAYRERALLKVGAKDPRGALADANEAVSLSPNSAFGLASALPRRSATSAEYATAITDCTHAIAVNPQSEYAYFNRGRAEISQEQWAAASSDFDKALLLDDTDTGRLLLARVGEI